MTKIGDLIIPANFLHSTPSSESGFSSKPGPYIAPHRLINGQNDFYIQQVETAKPKCKVLLFNYPKAFLWKPVLQQLAAAEVSLVYTRYDDFYTIDFSRYFDFLKWILLNGPFNSKSLQVDYCKRNNLSADEVLVVDEQNWTSFIEAQDPKAVAMSLEVIAYENRLRRKDEVQEYISRQLKAGRVVVQDMLSIEANKVKSGIEIANYPNQLKLAPAMVAGKGDDISISEWGISVKNEFFLYEQMTDVNQVCLNEMHIDKNNLSTLLKNLPKLRKLKLSESKGLEDGLPDDLSLGTLNDLVIESCRISALNLSKFLTLANQLKHLDLAWINLVAQSEDQFSTDIALVFLETLSLTGCNISASSLEKLLKNVPKLKAITVEDCKNLVGQITKNVAFPSLEKLELKHNEINCYNLEKLLKQASKLKRLNLQGLSLLSGELIEDLQLDSLEELGLRRTSISAASLTKLIKSAPQLKKIFMTRTTINGELGDLALANLESVYLSYSTITATNLTRLIGGSPKLRSLSLFEIQIKGELPFAIPLLSLEVFNLSETTIQATNLAKLIGHTTKLRALTLSNMVLEGELPDDLEFTSLVSFKLVKSHVTESDVGKLLKRADKLKMIELKQCYLEDTIIGELHLERLEELTLNDSTITAVNLSTLLKYAHNIRELNLSRAIVKGVLAIEPLESLESLYVWEYFTPAIGTLISKANNLKKIVLGDCKVRNLPERIWLPLLEVLDLTLTIITEDSYYKLLTYAPEKTNVIKENTRFLTEDSVITPANSSSQIIQTAISRERARASQSSSIKTMGSSVFPSSKSIARVDAQPTSHRGDFNLDLIFFGGPGAVLPAPNVYRLQTYNQMLINPAVCEPQDAFTLQSEGELDLIEAPINFSDTDVFSKLPKDSMEANYYYGKCKLTLSPEWQPLPSLSPQEQLLAMHTGGITVDIRYCTRDNLYYVKSRESLSAEVMIDFNLRVPKPIQMEIPVEIREQIKLFRSFESKPLVLNTSQATGKEYLLALASQKTGACRHRVVAFKAWMQEKYPNIPCRIILNDCHAFVEIFYNGHWLVQDLGGTAANLIINNSNQPKLETPAAKLAMHSSNEEEKTGGEVYAPAPQSILLPEVEKSNIRPVIAPEIRHIIDETFPLVKKQAESSLSLLHGISIAHGSNCLLEMKTQPALYATALTLQSIAKYKSQPVFRVNSPDDLICSAHYIQQEGNTGKVVAGPGGRLHDFLTQNNDPLNPPLIIVNFSAFSASDMVRFNQLIDETRFADGTPVPKDAVVVGLINPHAPGTYQGADFYSRFQKIISMETIAKPELPPFQSSVSSRNSLLKSSKEKIELYNSNQWRPLLLGGWTLEGAQLVFKPGALVKALAKGNTQLVFRNAPTSNPEYTAFIDQLRLFGGFESEGKWIKVPLDLSITYEKGFPWETLNQSITLDNRLELNPEATVLNGQTSSSFLTQFVCDNQLKLLMQTPGIIEQHKGKTLPVYLTHELNEQTWAQLLNEARKHQVLLEVKLAPGVDPPTSLIDEAERGDKLPALQKFQPYALSHTQVLLSRHGDLTLQQLQEAERAAIIIDVSEVEASDLLTKIDGRFNAERQSFEFNEHQGAVLQALNENKTVILKGDFKKELIEAFAPFLIARSHSKQAPGKLFLLANKVENLEFLPEGLLNEQHFSKAEASVAKKACLEREFQLDNAISQETIEQEDLVTLKARLRYQRAFPAGGDPWVGLETLPADAITTEAVDLNDSEAKTQAFFAERLEQVESMLKHSPHVFLSGLTGTGKSTFVLSQWKAKHPSCYFEKTAMKEWALNHSGDDIKTLFIDEANISQSEYTQFEGLFNTPPGILIDNIFYLLSKNHKVIFAGNPVSYGDERHLASFFKRHGGGVLFKPLPPYVLYEEVIRPLFEEKQKGTADRRRLEDLAIPFLQAQQIANNAAGKIIISPRELVTMALLTKNWIKNHPGDDPQKVAQYYAYQITVQSLPPTLLDGFEEKFPKPESLEPLAQMNEFLSDDDFVFTPSRKKLADYLDGLLGIRAHRRSSDCVEVSEIERYGGLAGLIVEGEAGIGKSELIIRQLVKHGFIKRNPNLDNSNQKCFYHIPASMSIEAKQTLLLKAFHEGNVVLMDEINSCPMMERFLNSLLTGFTPEGERPKNPGFLVIGTQNPVYMAGRRKQSDALKRRMLQFELPPYSDEEMKTILATKSSFEPHEIDYLVTRFHQRKSFADENDLPPPSFRDVLRVPELFRKAKSSAPISASSSASSKRYGQGFFDKMGENQIPASSYSKPGLR